MDTVEEVKKDESDLTELLNMFKGLTKINIDDLFERSLNRSMRNSLKLKNRTDQRKYFL